MASHEKKDITSQRLQKSYKGRGLTLNTILVLVLIGISGYFLYTTLVSTKALEQENALIKNELTSLLTGDPVSTYDDKTFVRYDQKPLAVTVYSSNTCTSCAAEIDKVIAKLQTSLPTLRNITVLDTDDKVVRESALRLGIGYLPGFVFTKDISETQFYEEGKDFFSEKSDGSQQFYTHALGHDPVKFIATTTNLQGFPSQDSSTVAQTSGQTTQQPVEIHAFLTTDCPACKTARDVVKSIERSNPDVEVVEHFSEDLQATSMSATKSIACAYEAGKGEAFTDTLFARQAAWLAIADLDPIFVRYARENGIPTDAFERCLAQENSELDMQERLFQTFGITQVPTIFIGNQRFVGVQTAAALNEAISAMSQ